MQLRNTHAVCIRDKLRDYFQIWLTINGKIKKIKFRIKPYKIDYADDGEFDELNYSLMWIKHSGFYIHVIQYWLWFRCLFKYTCKKRQVKKHMRLKNLKYFYNFLMLIWVVGMKGLRSISNGSRFMVCEELWVWLP